MKALFAIGKYKEAMKLYEAYPKKEQLSGETSKLYALSIKGSKRDEEAKAKIDAVKDKKKSEVN